MKLRAYLNLMPRGGMTEFAEKVGVSTVYLSQLAAEQDGRVPSPELCVVIEHATDGKVKRWDLRPQDWSRIWPELINTPGAPSVEEANHAGTGATC